MECGHILCLPLHHRGSMKVTEKSHVDITTFVKVAEFFWEPTNVPLTYMTGKYSFLIYYGCYAFLSEYSRPNVLRSICE